MGRLRNISNSFKAAAFPSAHTISSSQHRSGDSISENTTKRPLMGESALSSDTLQNGESSRTRHGPAMYTPPTLVAERNDDIQELKPVFSYLSSHANKLYQEGYFLKLDDLDTQGRPNSNRAWTECFAQLVGTVLSFWDAEALDAAGQDGEVAPSFINLADASIKMVRS